MRWEPLFARALSELDRVRRRGLGLRLLSAALLLVRERPGARGLPPLSLEAASLAEWRASVWTELDDAGADARSSRCARLLEGLTRRPLSNWPSAQFLAALGEQLAPGRTARLALAQVACLDGRRRCAERLLVALSEEDLDPESLWRTLYLLGLCHAAAGRERFALGAFDAAADTPTAGVNALVGAFALARLLDDEARARRAAARLDLLCAADDPGFQAALMDLAVGLVERARARRGDGRSGAGSPSAGVSGGGATGAGPGVCRERDAHWIGDANSVGSPAQQVLALFLP